MRTTVRIEDDLLRQLKDRAHQQNVSLTSLLNRVIRYGLEASRAGHRKGRFRQKTFAMGEPKIDINKALAFAAALEDEEIIRKMATGR